MQVHIAKGSDEKSMTDVQFHQVAKDQAGLIVGIGGGRAVDAKDGRLRTWSSVCKRSDCSIA